jgi:hypothetical protein
LPFIRYARDKRGYETTYVMHVYHPSSGAPRTRVLYLYRSPPNIKLGRPALDPEASEALEHTHPDLSFDWDALLRDPGAVRPEPIDRDRFDRDSWSRGGRRQRGRPGGAPGGRSERGGGRPAPHRERGKDRDRDRPKTPDDAPPAVVIDDESVLGRALGAGEAARLRARYRGMLERIARRARTPDERTRLTEGVTRLNPDDWPDEAAAQAGAKTVEAEWAAITAELPRRRRGRRGGRRRGGDAPSGIMTGHGDLNEPIDTPREAGVGRTDAGLDRPGEPGGLDADLDERDPGPGPADPDVSGDG